MIGAELKVGQHLKREEEKLIVRSFEGDDIVLEAVGKSALLTLSISEFYQEINAGIIQYAQPRRMVMQSSPLVTAEDRALAEKLADYLTALESEEFPCSHKTRVKVIEAVANKRGDFGKNRPSASALY